MSQETIARVLGCSMPAYQKWELGSSLPSADWLLRMLQLCPDEQTRNAFRIRRERRSETRGVIPGPNLQIPFSAEERLLCRDLARLAVDAIYDCGEAGNAAADARLKHFTENLQAAATYYIQARKSSRTA